MQHHAQAGTNLTRRLADGIDQAEYDQGNSGIGRTAGRRLEARPPSGFPVSLPLLENWREQSIMGRHGRLHHLQDAH